MIAVHASVVCDQPTSLEVDTPFGARSRSISGSPHPQRCRCFPDTATTVRWWYGLSITAALSSSRQQTSAWRIQPTATFGLSRL